MPYTDQDKRRARKREYMRVWRAAHPDLAREQSRAASERRRARDPRHSKKWVAEWHGITRDEYDQMVEEQGGRCAICGTAPETDLHIDHDHGCCPGRDSCGKCIRGLLCVKCNVGMGSFNDNPRLLEAAKEYLVMRSSGGQ